MPSTRRRAVFALPAVLACTLLAAPQAGADPAPAPACASAREVVVSTAVPLLDWAENLGADARGDLWVSRVQRNEVVRYDAAGVRTATVPVESPGAVRQGPDGLMYVVTGDSVVAVGQGGVVRFDPAAPEPVAEVFATGLDRPNGAAFGPDGALYVAGYDGVHRLRPDGTEDTAWSAAARLSLANGITAQGDSLYVTANGVALGQVVRLSRANPAVRETLTTLTGPAGLPDFADDVTWHDGAVYATTLTGRLTRVDPVSGRACTVLTTRPLTAVLPDPAAPGTLLVTSEDGTVARVHPAD
ncbi:SMP-30/gluconolactonase/LRE family protein [Nocardia thailandica]|uniref:SMP-30/gluconolactonase/LRE family protein n=1 Tax=Nocardia thailandica TaxID=257275 RepID=A0ABW6PKM3_9NOCA